MPPQRPASAGSTIVAARWVLPIARRPMERAWVEVRDQRVVAVSTGRPPTRATDLGDVALLPGLVNAHTHLELSWLAGQVPPAESFTDWVRALLRRRGPADGRTADDRVAAMRSAAAAMKATGTAIVGDVSNELTAVPVLREAGLGGRVFHEILGFHVRDPATVTREAWRRLEGAGGLDDGPRQQGSLRGGVSAHAPYSTAPELIEQIARQHRGGPLTIHLAESAEEIEFLRSGRGPLRQLLEDLGVFNPAWRPPACDPVEYLGRLGYLTSDLLAIHGVHLGEAGLERIRRAGGVLVTCARSNVWVGAGLPRLARAYGLGIPVAVGTDSLASVATLNLFDELAELRRIAPEVSAASLLESATRVGAEALGFGEVLGTIAPGKRAVWTAVDVPVDTRDVEEYLVSGVPATAVRPVWL